MDIREPSVGPIVGRTSSSQANVFIRGEDAGGFGVAQVCRPGGVWSPIDFTPLDPTRDNTGLFTWDRLLPGREYEYRIGWTPVPPPPGAMPPEGDWARSRRGRFRTAPEDRQASRSYAVGSCRHLRNPLQPARDDGGDEIFGSIRRLHEREHRFDAFFMLGDQIYADAPLWDSVTRPDEFLALYRCTFGKQPKLRELMARVPTYMMLDDHEIQDNWPARADAANKAVLEQAALETYRIYQCTHNPATAAHLWYEFSDGCAEWFVMDTRSKRDLQAGRMLDPAQFDALCAFLQNGSGLVKLVASTVPIFPDHAWFASDKWEGFPQQRREIFRIIREQRIPKVVFVSGDVHCSFAARLDLGNGVAVHTVVSSPFVTSIPFGAIWRWSFRRPLVDAGTSAKPQLLSDGPFWRRNFAHLRVQPERMFVSFYDREGEPLQKDLHIAF
jgi:alkaline phosphatase D